MLSKTLPHWLAPTVLLSSFLAAVALAIGHHVYYASLHGSSPTGRKCNPVTIGNAIVLAARTMLITTITTAYWQVFWRVLKKKLPIATIDSLAGALSALDEILSLRTVRASPLLVGLALMGWCIRMALVFPADALAVGGNYTTLHYLHILQYPNLTNADAHTETSTGHIPRNPKRGGTVPGEMLAGWAGPTTSLRGAATTVFYRGVPSVPAARDNGSYSLAFDGPTVVCQGIDAEPVVASLVEAMVNCRSDSAPLNECDGQSFQYLSWTPGTVMVSFNSCILDRSLPSTGLNALSYGLNSEWMLGSPTALLIATRILTDRMKWSGQNCSLYKAAYEVDFALQSVSQNITVKYNVLGSIGPDAQQPIRGSPNPFALSSSELKPCFAIMELVGNMLTGKIFENYDAVPKAIYQTRILETVLAFTQEIFPIYQGYAATTQGTNITRPTLAAAIEELVQNITIALFTEPLLTNESHVMTDIVVQTYETVYFYDSTRLVLSYGIALALALSAVVIGQYTIVTTGQSYSNNFSTILRVAQNKELSVLVEECDRRGEDPLPKHIGKAKFWVDGQESLRKRVGRDLEAEH